MYYPHHNSRPFFQPSWDEDWTECHDDERKLDNFCESEKNEEGMGSCKKIFGILINIASVR